MSEVICPYCLGTGHVTRREMTSDQAIEYYYRSRAAGSQKTLREVAEETGFNHGYLRQVKQRYDADGKWGSRK